VVGVHFCDDRQDRSSQREEDADEEQEEADPGDDAHFPAPAFPTA
jgi:hypothetical protein